jgi:hypothetical protein
MNLLTTNRRKTVTYYDFETMDWVQRVIAAGGTVTQAWQDAVQAFVSQCKLQGLWPLLDEVGPFISGGGSALAGALVKLKYVTAASLTNNNFTSGDYSASTGLLGDGTTKFLNTSYNILTSLPDASHFSFYLREVLSGGGNRAMMGVIDNTGADQFVLYASGAGTDISSRLGQNVTANNAGAGSPTGFHMVSRQSLTDLRLYRNGAQVGVTNVTAVTLTKPNRNVYLWGWDNAGVQGALLPQRGCFYSIGSAMTPAQASAYYTLVQALQTAMGGRFNRKKGLS